jgi:hypothetical protein
MARKPLNAYFFFIFFVSHTNPRIMYSARTKGEIAIHPTTKKIFSPIGYFILFPLFLFRLDTLRREERGEVGYGALVVV